MNISLIRLFSHLGHLSLIIMSSAIKVAMSTLLDKYMLTGSNFIDWLHNVRIVLRTESLLHILDGSIPSVPSEQAHQEELDAFDKYMSQQTQV